MILWKIITLTCCDDWMSQIGMLMSASWFTLNLGVGGMLTFGGRMIDVVKVTEFWKDTPSFRLEDRLVLGPFSHLDCFLMERGRPFLLTHLGLWISLVIVSMSVCLVDCCVDSKLEVVSIDFIGMVMPLLIANKEKLSNNFFDISGD